MNQFPSVSSFSNKKFEKSKPAIVICTINRARRKNLEAAYNNNF
jgi:hypothetical protein